MRHEFHEFTPIDPTIHSSPMKFVTIRAIRVFMRATLKLNAAVHPQRHLALLRCGRLPRVTIPGSVDEIDETPASRRFLSCQIEQRFSPVMAGRVRQLDNPSVARTTGRGSRPSTQPQVARAPAPASLTPSGARKAGQGSESPPIRSRYPRTPAVRQ